MLPGVQNASRRLAKNLAKNNGVRSLTWTLDVLRKAKTALAPS
jgi:hypothetical protein